MSESCRYWIADTYDQRHAAGLEPQNIDKEFIRLWFRAHCDPYHDPVCLAEPALFTFWSLQPTNPVATAELH